MERIWVRVNGIDVDPAYKEMAVASGIDLGTLFPYNQSQLMSGAGGLIGSNWVKNVNASSIETKLQTWTTAFLTNLKTNHPNASMADIVGGSEIVPINVLKGDLQSLAITASGTSFSTPEAKRMHTVKITVGTEERIINMPDIDGRVFGIGSIPGSPRAGTNPQENSQL